ncbi:MAG: F0F1 ATP synthase subunit B [Aquamicrobium sp.]|jgi:F-type H+-transporting ATPase subunit b|uniref:F0F1 ATP synthase subunit B n=1 Tax=Mesorhizobium sp. Pch-S TaxID=2082387 RepID=UPI0010113DFF|nr:F0F1 ATP synthase subunit B [Mesorhizobium sp. Pch-S]MBR2689743.1 F0F1 ATP synthase subunit B [Aquamicrobium sp.]QAZ42119.1 ATP F0F1 synthase subunit B' [Mesorhizobium sp. Pch-S]
MFVTPAYAEEAAPAAAGDHAAHGETQAGTQVPAEGGHGGNTFPPFNPATFSSQLFWLVITFGLFYIFLKKVVMPRLGGILEVRSNRIAQDLDQAAKLKGEADAAVAAYEQELAEAKANANTIGQKSRDEAKAEAETARKSVEAGLEKKLAEAEERITAIKTSAMKDVGSIAETTASAILDSLVGKSDKAEVAAAVKAAR